MNFQMNEPARRQHYYFVHEYLRAKCLGAPVPALRDFSHEKATEHLRIAWTTLGMLHKDPDAEFIPPEGVEVVPFEIGSEFKAAILVFPHPERLNEAFMAAIVVARGIQVEGTSKSRYFTLEYNPDRPEPHTYIGEWIDESHFNLGGGPPPTVEEFKQAIVGLVSPAADNEIIDEEITIDEDIQYRGLIIGALGAWDRVRDDALANGSLAAMHAEILNELLFHHPEVRSLDLKRMEVQMGKLQERFLEEIRTAYFKVDPALVDDPTSDLAIETVSNYAIDRLSEEALKSGDTKLAENIRNMAPHLIDGLKEVARKNHRN
jgi:hypothetical protein